MKKIFVVIFILVAVFIYSYTDITLIKKQIKEYEEYLIDHPKDTNKMFELARLYEYIGENGDTDSFNRAKNIYQKILDIKYDPQAQILYGSMLLKIGRNQWFIPIKLWYVYSGYSEMSDAVKFSPYSIKFRYIRANSCYELQSFPFCVDTAIIDYEYILNNSNYDTKLLVDNNAEILFKLANLKELKGNLEEAYNLYNKIISNYNTSSYTQLAKKHLKKLEKHK